MLVRASSLCSGSSGNAIFIQNGQDKFVVDCGLNGRQFASRLASLDVMPQDLQGIVITHEHKDHISGLGVVLRRYGLPLYITEKTLAASLPEIGSFDASLVRVLEAGTAFAIGDTKLTPIELSHDAVEPQGYRIHTAKGDIAICTDTGSIHAKTLKSLLNAKLLFLEANYDEELLRLGPYPKWLKQRVAGDYGHLSNRLAGKLLQFLLQQGTEKIVLSHLSKQNNYPALAQSTVCSYLKQIGAKINADYQLLVAPRYEPSPVMEL